MQISALRGGETWLLNSTHKHLPLWKNYLGFVRNWQKHQKPSLASCVQADKYSGSMTTKCHRFVPAGLPLLLLTVHYRSRAAHLHLSLETGICVRAPISRSQLWKERGNLTGTSWPTASRLCLLDDLSLATFKIDKQIMSPFCPLFKVNVTRMILLLATYLFDSLHTTVIAVLKRKKIKQKSHIWSASSGRHEGVKKNRIITFPENWVVLAGVGCQRGKRQISPCKRE